MKFPETIVWYILQTELIQFLFSGILAFVNCWDVKWATFVQDIFTYAKLTALFAIIIAGIVQLGRGKVEYFTWDNTEDDITKIALSFYSGLFAYNGWNYLNFVIEELQDPVKNLPRYNGYHLRIDKAHFMK